MYRGSFGKIVFKIKLWRCWGKEDS